MNELKFSCPHCAQHISCDSTWAGHSIQCPSCQQQIAVPSAGVPLATSRPPVTSAPAPIPAPSAAVQPARPWCGLAIASLVLCSGIGFGFLGWIAGVICGHMAKTRIRLNPNLRGMGMATAGLIINYTLLSILIFAVGFAVIGGPIIKKRQEARRAQQRQEWAAAEARRNESHQQAAAENRIAYREPKLEIPTNAVSGFVNGNPFRYDHALAENFSFTLREGQYWRADRQVKITTWVKPQDLANKTLLVTPDMRSPRLTVAAEWLDKDKKTQRTVAMTGYSLRMKCGPIENGKMKGSIDLQMPGTQATAIKGDFVAAVK